MTKSLPALLACLLFSACTSSPKVSEPGAKITSSETKPLVGAFEVQRTVLSNGLKILVLEDHSSPTFAYQTWVNVGSRDEVMGKTGLAHLFEHLMFKATTNHPEGEFDRILESAGVEDENAFTSWDYTAYIQELPKDKLDLIAKLESDRMVHLAVNDQSFKTEREVVQNERRFRNENSPDGMIFQDLYELAFTRHPYHWPIIGYEKDLASMTSQDARDFYRAYYSPNHATIVVVGDVSNDDVVKTIQKYYGGIAAQNSPVHAILEEPAQTKVRRKVLPLSIQIEKLTMAYHMPGIADPDVPALMVLDSVLTGGRSSRLQRALVETGIASSIETSPMEQKDPTLFIFECNLQRDRKAVRAENVILHELSKLAHQLVSEAELQRAKHRAEFSFYQRLDSAGEKANFLGRYETMTGNFETGLEIEKKMMTVTPQQLQAVVQKYFSPRTRTVVTGVIK